MNVNLNRWLWAVVAVLAVGFVACSKTDEPQQPDPNTEQEDPNGPGTDPGQQEEPVENWEGEEPHGFIFDIDSIYMPLTEDGFLMVSQHSTYTDAIVMHEESKRPKENNRSKEGVMWGMDGAHGTVRLVGKQKANPWVNVDKYIEMCQTIHVRADSKFSNFPELEGLPVGNLQIFGLMTVETLVNVDVISHNYFCADIPAGGSMRGPEKVWGGDEYAVYTILQCIVGENIFKVMQKAPYVVGGPGPYSMLSLGKMNARYIYPAMSLWIINYPDEPGEYPMTLRMEFASGKVLTKDFKVRYVNEE